MEDPTAGCLQSEKQGDWLLCCPGDAAGTLMQLQGSTTALAGDAVKLSSMLYRRSVRCIPSLWQVSHPVPHRPPLPAAINVNGDGSATAAASSSDVVVGAPLPPSISVVTGGVGQLTVTWSAPDINADLGVTYTLNVEDVTAGRTPATPLVTQALTAGAPSQTVSGLAAGTKRVWITATNANAGDGKTAGAVQTAWAGAVVVQLSTQPSISQTTGSESGATITVAAPSASSATAINKFLIQVRFSGTGAVFVLTRACQVSTAAQCAFACGMLYIGAISRICRCICPPPC